MSAANIVTVQAMYAAFGRRDVPAILKELTPDVEWYSGGRATDFPTLGPRKGVAQVQEFFRLVEELQEFSEFAPKEFYADKDKVFVLGHYTMKVLKTGRNFASDWVHVFTFHNGKVTAFREFLDTAPLAEAYRA